VSAAWKLIEELSSSGVLLAREGDKLVLDGPEVLITEALVESVRALKSEILQTLGSYGSLSWRAHFSERVGIAEFEHGLSRAEAEARAFECCVVEWLNRHPEPSDPGRCAWCGNPDESGHAVLPFGTDSHTWLHPGCWSFWSEKRRGMAEKWLCAAGLTKPIAGKNNRREGNGDESKAPAWQ
jgi:TubC N-terminal docking domain